MARTTPQITIAVISNHPLAAEFILHNCRRNRYNTVFAWRESKQTRHLCNPDAFVLDASTLVFPMPECLRRLRHRFPDSKFIVVGDELSDDEIARLFLWGVHGFVPYAMTKDLIGAALRKVHRGGLWVSERVLARYVQLTARRTLGDRVTPREDQVLQLLRKRLSNKEIAEILNVRENTVKYHVSNILTKLHASSRRELQPAARILPIWSQLAG